MNHLLLLIAQNAVLLVAGTTVLLALGCGAVLLCKSPIHRQRISELTIAGVLGWIVLALFPLPRLLPEHFFSAKPRAAAPESLVALETTAPLPARIHDMEPILLPEISEWVIEDASIQEANSVPPVGRPFRAVAGGPEGPSYCASPSEELSGQSAASITPAPSAWKFDRTQLAGLCTGAYLAGAALCLLWIITGHVLLLRIRQTAESPPEWLANQYRSLAKQSGIAPPQLIVSHLCTRPLSWGVLWPVVVLPQSLCRQENKSQLDTILLHELGHIAQQDSQGNLLFCAALPLLYAHPLFWWLRRESQLAAELVADDWAAWQTGKETYVEELVALARCTGTSSLPLVGVTGLFSSPSQFYRRMHMLLAREKPLSTKTSLPWRLASLSALAGAVVLAAALAGVRPVVGQSEPPEITPAPPAATPEVASPAAAPAPVDPLNRPALPNLFGNSASPSNPPVGTLPAAAPPNFTQPKTTITFTADDSEAALLAEIHLLQEKLQAIKSKTIATHGTLPDGAIKPGKKTLTLARDSGDGVLSIEVWTTDEKGQPAKLLSKTASAIPTAASRDGKTITQEFTAKDGSHTIIVLDAATGKVIATAPYPAKELQNSPDWKRIVKEVVDKDGVRRHYWLDAATGKVIESVPPLGKGATPAQPRLTPPAADPNIPQNPAAPRTTTARRSELRFPTPIMPVAPSAAVPVYEYNAVVRPAGEPNMARGAQQLDLVSLATSYADAVGVLETAQAEVDEHGKLSDQNVISQREVRAAKLALSAAQRKEQLLRSIAQVATDSAAQEFERTSLLHKSGQTTASAAGEAKARMDILKQILHMQPAESGPKK